MKVPVQTAFYSGMAEVWRLLAQACDAVAEGREADAKGLVMSALAKHRVLFAWPPDMSGLVAR